NVVTPMHLLEEYAADGVRYWAAGARLGTDTVLDEKVMRVGKRLVTKLFNAGKFVLAQSGDAHPIDAELDRGFAAGLATPAATGSFEAAVACLAAINRSKSEAGVSVGRGVRRLVIAAHPTTLDRLRLVLADVAAAARVEGYDLEPTATLADGVVEVRAPEF